LMPYFQVPLLHLASLPDALSLHCDVSLQRSTAVSTPTLLIFPGLISVSLSRPF
jgi:hypothetical protein